jgi:hypothetical protein
MSPSSRTSSEFAITYYAICGDHMTNPWDRPPFPSKGDDNQDILYAAVGRVISQWENVELGLSHLYAIFIGQPFSVGIYAQYYEPSKTFMTRLAAVERQSERFFQKAPNQEIEGDFCDLVKRVSGFSERRHEVAHGFVRPIQWYRVALPSLSAPDGPFQYCVVPPHYQANWFGKSNMPHYVYTSTELAQLELLMFRFGQDITSFRYRLLQPASP